MDDREKAIEKMVERLIDMKDKKFVIRQAYSQGRIDGMEEIIKIMKNGS